MTDLKDFPGRITIDQIDRINQALTSLRLIKPFKIGTNHDLEIQLSESMENLFDLSNAFIADYWESAEYAEQSALHRKVGS